MRLKVNFITHDMGDEHYTIPTGGSSFKGVVRSNKTAAFVVECLKTDVTKEEIVKAMLEKYNASEDVIRKDVEKAIDILRSIGAIEE